MEGLNPNSTVEVLYSTKALIGEGPFYEEETGLLIWIDIMGQVVNFLDPIKKTNRIVRCCDTLGAAIGVEYSSKLLVMLGRKICLIDRNSGSVTDELCSVEDDKPGNRLNDAKCDSSGRVWCGTMSIKEHPEHVDPGSGLYSYSAGLLQRHCHAIVSNGITWNLADDAMYFIDSFKKKLFSWSYNSCNGCVSDQKVLIDYAEDPELGLPDGMCTDEKGRLWVASFGTQRVTCWDPQTKERVLTVMIPGAKYVTSCCFGGPNYEWLFVTSASSLVSEEDFKIYPNSGSVFVIKDLGTCGFPAHKFKQLEIKLEQ